jgi:hypothetical protein
MVVVDLEVPVDLETIQQFRLLLVVLVIHKDLQHPTDQEQVTLVLQILVLAAVLHLEHQHHQIHHHLVEMVDQVL